MRARMIDMQIRKAVITAGGRNQRNLPMQTLFDQEGVERSVLSLVVREAARAGLARQAEQIEKTIEPLVDVKNPEQVAYEHYLQGEVALLHGENDKAIQLFSLSDQEKSTPFSMEGLARAYQQSGNMKLAVSQYERFLTSTDHGLLWEPQQRWIAAHYTLAADDMAMENPAKARAALDPLLALWKDADPDLPLRKQAFALSERLR